MTAYKFRSVLVSYGKWVEICDNTPEELEQMRVEAQERVKIKRAVRRLFMQLLNAEQSR